MMAYSFKNKLLHGSIFSVFLLLINIISCKEKKEIAINKVTINNQEQLNQKRKILDSCSFFDKHILINENDFGEIVIKLNDKISSKKIILNQLNFSIHNISKISINCSTKNEFQLIFNENMGNNYYLTYHLFKLDSISNKYTWYKIYKTESTRQGISIIGANLNEPKEFKNYNAQENENLNFLNIYSFVGFQEEKEPMIKPFYDKIESLSTMKNSKIKLYGDKFVLEYLIKNIRLNAKNLSQYNDIGFFLEQSKLYTESIYLLKEIIKNFPKRTMAYINIGDAYWNSQNKEKAKDAYKIYIEQMKEKGKEQKIPKRIYERIK